MAKIKKHSWWLATAIYITLLGTLSITSIAQQPQNHEDITDPESFDPSTGYIYKDPGGEVNVGMNRASEEFSDGEHSGHESIYTKTGVGGVVGSASGYGSEAELEVMQAPVGSEAAIDAAIVEMENFGNPDPDTSETTLP